ncbi:MAG: hypothetical protein ACM33B_04995 [Pseudomonadota bacterium]
MGRAPAVLRQPRVVAGGAILTALLVYYRVVDELPAIPTWADVLFTAFVLVPAVFALVLLALPLYDARGILPVAVALAALAFVLVQADLDVLANFTKLAAVTLLAFWFLSYFEALSWVVIVACVIPVVDAVSVWRGPTRHIVEQRPEVFGALSFAFPVPGTGAFQLGLPDLLFFAIFLGAAQRWHLRVLTTWILLVASFGATMALAIYVDPFGIGGLPALPLLCVGFLAANADLIRRRLRLEREAQPDAEATE